MLKQINDQEKEEIKRCNQREINALIEQIDMLTRKIEAIDEQYEGPK